MKEIIMEKILSYLRQKENYEVENESKIGGFDFGFNQSDKYKSFGFNLRRYPRSLKCSHFNAGITFYAIENILTPILVTHELIGRFTKPKDRWTIGIGQHYSMNLGLSYKTESKLPFIIENEEDIGNFVKLCIEYYEEEAKTFFNYWTDIEQFVPIIEEMTLMELIYFFGLGGRLKKAIIWKLTSHPDYDNYFEILMQDFYKSAALNPKESNHKKFINAAIELREVLKSFP